MAAGAGNRVRLAARYRPARPLEARLALGVGSCDAAGGVLPSGEWRPAAAAELEALVGAPGEIDRDHIWLFGLPRHLLRRWWELADQAETGGADGLPGFDQYARDVAEYFAYKRWPLPADSLIEAAAADPASQAPGKLRPGSQWPFSAGPAQLVACINLDESECAMVLPAGSPAGSDADSNPPSGIPLLKVRLGAGEGLFVPSRASCAILYAADQDLGIYLMIGSGGN